MTAILEILAQIWPFLLAGLGVLFGWMRHKQAQTTAARADQRVAEAEKQQAQAGAAVAQANQEAARAGAKNQEIRRDENTTAAAVPDANRVLHDEWGDEGRN